MTESAKAERERHDREIAEENKRRQMRLGPAPTESEKEASTEESSTEEPPPKTE